MQAPINSEDCFLEAHYYSGGLKHFAFRYGARPQWAPDKDAVGFRDEFELNNGDSAVEVRRFLVGSDQVTWIGLYFRSIDLKLGDRGNHAGVGAWYRNALPVDFPHLLHGLELLARRIAAEPDPANIASDAARFSAEEARFALDTGAIDPSPGFEFNKPGLVETKRVEIHCATSVSVCRTLTEYLAELTYLQTEAVPPRVLVHLSANPSGNALKDDSDVMGKFIRTLRAADRARAKKAEHALEAASAKSKALELDLQTLTAETADLQSFRDDPLRGVERRLDEISRVILNLQDRPPAAALPQPAEQFRQPVRRRPISPSSRQPSPIEGDTKGLSPLEFLILLGAGLIGAVVLLFFLVDWIFPIDMSKLRWG
jgi:hypothetical protein